MRAREESIAAVRRRLAGRRVVWFGIRGEDGEALLELPELEASFATTAPMRSPSVADERNVALEGLSGVRPDLDREEDTAQPDHATQAFRRSLLRELSERCVLMTYRPTALTSALSFAMAETMTLAGMSVDRQAAFEYKPWVETMLTRAGIPGLNWTYVADEHRDRAKRLLADGPQILRASRTSGGVGIEHVRSAEDVDAHWPTQPETFVAISPFLKPSVPLNLSGCVFDDGSVRLHPASVQLIGIRGCTTRPFGYCGNDFGAVRDLDADVLDQITEMGRRIGRWLHAERYRGAFGVDALLHDGIVRFVEVNPRFQGSSAVSAEIAADAEAPDLFLDHLAAMLGLPPTGPPLTVADWARTQPAVAQIVVHNVRGGAVRHDPTRHPYDLPRDCRLAQLGDGVRVDPGGTLCRLVVSRSVTATGAEIDQRTRDVVARLDGAFTSTASP